MDPADPRPLSPSSVPAELTAALEQILPGLHGWCTLEKATELVSLIFDNDLHTCVEIGVFGGRSLLPMAMAIRHRGTGGVAWGVDPWTAQASLQGSNAPANDTWWASLDYEAVFRSFTEAVLANGLTTECRTLRLTSETAARIFDVTSIDLLHIDGNHADEVSLHDVRTWLPRVTDGGFIVMDDTDWPTTKRATSLLRQHCDVVADHGSHMVFRVRPRTDAPTTSGDESSVTSLVGTHFDHAKPLPAYIGQGRCVVRVPFGVLCFLGQGVDVGPQLWRGEPYEPHVMAVLRTILGQGDTYVNVGANFGYHTIFGGSIVGASGKVIAVEANPRIFECLMRSIFLSEMTDRIRPHHAAAAGTTGAAMTLATNPVFPSGGGLIANAEGMHEAGSWEDADFGSRGYVDELGSVTYPNVPFLRYDVRTVALDDIWTAQGSPSVRVLHLDIEGGEFLALSGAQELIGHNPAVHIVVEIAAIAVGDTLRFDAFEAALSKLESLGMRCCRLLPTRDGSISLIDVDLRRDIHQLVHGDYLFIPPGSVLFDDVQ
jgi:FkbM family methyltransferase